MNNIKKYVKPLVFTVVSLVLYLIILCFIHYFGMMKLSSISKVNFIVLAVLTFSVGIFIGKKTSKKGYLEGLKFGSMLAILLFLFNVVFYRHIDLYVFLYYMLLIVSPTIGGMIGINIRH